jgi:hypothetical protein
MNNLNKRIWDIWETPSHLKITFFMKYSKVLLFYYMLHGFMITLMIACSCLVMVTFSDDLFIAIFPLGLGVYSLYQLRKISRNRKVIHEIDIDKTRVRIKIINNGQEFIEEMPTADFVSITVVNPNPEDPNDIGEYIEKIHSPISAVLNSVDNDIALVFRFHRGSFRFFEFGTTSQKRMMADYIQQFMIKIGRSL